MIIKFLKEPRTRYLTKETQPVNTNSNIIHTCKNWGKYKL